MHEGQELKKYIKLSPRTLTEIAEKSGISRDTMYELYKREKIEKEYVDKLVNVGVDFLPKVKTDKSGDDDNDVKTGKLVPYYDIDAIGGTVEIFTDGKEHVSAYVSFPGFDDCDCFLNYSGDSMFPKYKSGQIIGLKRITDFEVIQYGEAFMIVTKENRMVKYVRKGSKEEKVLLVSENPKFDPFEVHKSKILFLFIVKGNIEKNVL